MLYYRRARIELDRIPFYDIASFTVRDCRAFYWKVLFSLFKSCWNTWIKSIRYIYYYIVDTCAHIWICTLWSQSCSEFYWKGCVQFNRSVLLRLYAYMCIHPDKSIWQYWFVYCERSANLCTGRQYIVTYTDMHALNWESGIKSVVVHLCMVIYCLLQEVCRAIGFFLEYLFQSNLVLSKSEFNLL